MSTPDDEKPPPRQGPRYIFPDMRLANPTSTSTLKDLLDQEYGVNSTGPAFFMMPMPPALIDTPAMCLEMRDTAYEYMIKKIEKGKRGTEEERRAAIAGIRERMNTKDMPEIVSFSASSSSSSDDDEDEDDEDDKESIDAA